MHVSSILEDMEPPGQAIESRQGYTLSVILPVYNHAAYLPISIEALLRQDRPADEIIIVDDGSTDESAAIAARMAEEQSTIRVINSQRNEGVISALNKGLAAAHGRYLYFAAADDWVLPRFFSRGLTALRKRSDLGAFCGESLLVNLIGKELVGQRPIVKPRYSAGPISPGKAHVLLRRSDNWMLTGATIFRRDAVLWAGAFDSRLGTFADGFMARKIALTHGFYFEPAPVSVWSVHADSVSRRTALDPRMARAILDEVPTIIGADPVFPPWYRERFQSRWRFAASRLALAEEPVNCELLRAMARPSSIEGALCRQLVKGSENRLLRLTDLYWLSVRLRPTIIRGLARTSLNYRRQRAAAALLIGSDQKIIEPS